MRIFLFPLFLSALLVGCGGNSDTSAVSDADFQRQLDEYDAQSAIVDRQQWKADEQAARFDALLDRWEEQADRQDRILDQLEAKASEK